MLINERRMAWDGLPTRNPNIDGERVRLRGPLLSDEELIRRASACPEIPHVKPSVLAGGKEAVVNHIAALAAMPVHRQGYAWTVCDADTGEAVGHIGVGLAALLHGRAVVGYWVLPEHRRRGYASEALKVVTEFLGKLPPVTRIELHIDVDNAASWKLAERSGYTREATLSRWQIVDGVPRDMYMYVSLPALDR